MATGSTFLRSSASLRAVLLPGLFLVAALPLRSAEARERPLGDRNPRRYLVGITESDTAGAPGLTTDGPWTSVYSARVDARAGDLLRIRGQVEITNDYRWPVGGQIRIVADDQLVGIVVSQNCISTLAGHHMPLWVDGVLEAPADRFVTVAVQYRAFCRQARVIARLESGYGHLVIEQYRCYPDRQMASDAGARVLVDWRSDRSEDASRYGGQFEKRALAYNVDLDAAVGDLVRVYGQATSAWQSGVVEMHGQGILVNDRLAISPWSTENTPWSIQYVPLATDGVHYVNGAGPFRYSLSMHGVKQSGGRPIVAHGGHLFALRFRRVGLLNGQDALVLLESRMTSAATAPATITANDGFRPITTKSLHLDAGDVVRITGLLQLDYPAAYAEGLGIDCVARCELRDAAGTPIDASAYWQKYITPPLQHLPLRTEQLVRVEASGDYTVVLQAKCLREGAAPRVAVRGDQTLLLIDRFGLLPPVRNRQESSP